MKVSMHFSIRALCALPLIAVLPPTFATNESSALALPTTESVQAKVMQIGMPMEAQRVAARLQAAMSSQPEWARKYIAEHGNAGKPLPYHPNFQVTESEYRAFLAAALSPSLVQVGTVKLTAEVEKDGRIVLSTEPPTLRVHGVAIQPDRRSVVTPIATLMDSHSIVSNGDQGATGRWSGIQWSSESVAGNSIVKFAVGKRANEGDGIIYYDVRAASDDRDQSFYEILLYPLAK